MAGEGLVVVIETDFRSPNSGYTVADRAKYQPGRYEDRWAPLLISWTTPDETPAFTGDIAGFGGSSPIQAGDAPWIYVTGQVQLDGPMAQQMVNQGSAAQVASMLLHEMGHVVGLAHAESGPRRK